MRRTGIFLGVLAMVVVIGWTAAATSVGVGVGFDPTGLVLINALTELPIAPFFDVRAEVGFASGGISGLMVATASGVFHFFYPPVDPFLGLGVGAAITPPPYSTGLVFEGFGGLRLLPIEPVQLYIQVRYLLRWSGSTWTTGPVYEAGVEVRF